MANITIVGTGNAGCAHAAMFSHGGHRVTLFKTSKLGNVLNFNTIRERKAIAVTMLDGRDLSADIYRVTDDPVDAFEDCEICFVMVQTLYHRQVSEIVGKYAKHLKLLFVVPGYMGSLYFKKAMGGRADIIAEGESTAYDARIIADGHVKILFKNVRNAIAVLQGDPQKALKEMSGLVETYQYLRKNIVESALHNPNLIVHTIGCIMSASRIEYSGGEFWMYKEAFTPSIWNVVKALDEEKMKILEKAGCERIPYLEACKFRNCEDLTVDALSVFKNYAATGGPKGPTVVRSRYVLEDVPNGLCLMASLGRHYGVVTPVCDSLVELASVLVGEDLKKQGRSYEDMVGL